MDSEKIYKKIAGLYESKIFVWGIIAFGILVRFAQYLPNRSLWTDEASLVSNILNRTYSGFFKPLDYKQGAPIGFLMVERFLVTLFGGSEYVLRLFPLICGISAIFIFYKIADDYINKKAVPIALALFSTATSLIYYSSEVKQYSTDVAVGLALYLLASYISKNSEITKREIIVSGALGALAIWFSYPSVFILAGIGIIFLYTCYRKKDGHRAWALLQIYFIWAVSLTVYYFVSLRHLGHDSYMLSFWNLCFMPPLLPFSSFFKWMYVSFFKILDFPVSQKLVGISALMFIVGFISLLRDRRKSLAMVTLPIFITLLVSALHKYPFGSRLVLFIVPYVLLVIAEGVWCFIDNVKDKMPSMVIAMLVLIFFFPLVNSVNYIRYPNMRNDIKPLIRNIEDKALPGDIVYVCYNALRPFKYYAKRMGFKHKYVIGARIVKDWRGRRFWDKYEKDFIKIRGYKRVWVLLSHISADESKFLLYRIGKMGKPTGWFSSPGALLYLYDLN